jgi:parvulin-like peptidyl-prolyl isomerase
MRRFIPILILQLFMTCLLVSPAAASWWGDDTLVTIDGTQYTTDDFKRWWGYFNDSGMTLPETPDFYIDWLLLAREGESMQLTEDPSFQNKTKVFLKVRSLLLLQNEEVNKRIKITDDKLRARYEKFYTPLWLLERLQFADEKSAKTAWQELKDGAVTIDSLEKRPQEQGGPMNHREDWRRPTGMNEYWSGIFRKLTVGEASEPIKDLDYFVFYVLKKQEDGSDEDFEKLRQSISEKIWKEEQDALTAALVFKLREKFDVKVEEKRLADLDLDQPDDAYGDEPIITTNHGNFSEKQFMDILRRDEAYRKKSRHEKIDPEEVKKRVLNGIIEQNVTNWEAIDRHYEKQEPFKWEYQFNVRHRLNNAVLDRHFGSGITVSEEDIKNYYKEHISLYTQPEMVDLVLIEDTQGDVDRVWGEVATGKDFYKAVKEITEQATNPQSLPFPHLDPSVQKIVEGMTKGETSQPFTVQGHRFLVFLADRSPAKPLPLEQVTQSIRSRMLQEKMARKRKEYLDLLKSKSEIKVNESNWQAVQKELGGTK